MSGAFRCWRLRGRVIHGHGRGGTQLGFPTANIELDAPTTAVLNTFGEQVLYGWGCIEQPTQGKSTGTQQLSVTLDDCGPFPFAMSLGHNPHFHDKQLSAEVHFMHQFPTDFYDSIIRVYVLGLIREQQKYNSLEEVIVAINHDTMIAREALASARLSSFAQHRFVQPDAQLTAEENACLPYLKVDDLDARSIDS